MTTVGFIGPGAMGAPMVEKLTAAGHRVDVLARREQVREQLKRAGARLVDDPAGAAANADVLIVCLFSDEQLAEVGPQALVGLRPGSVLASHVTGSPALLHRLAATAAPRGITVVDAPVSGDVPEIRNGELTVLLGGEPHAVGAAAAVMQSYASPVIRTGALGSALAVKLVNNLLFAANCRLVAEAVTLAAGLEVSAEALLSTLTHMSAESVAAQSIRQLGGIDAFYGRAEPFLSKDVSACRAAAAEAGVNPALLLAVADNDRHDAS